MTRRKKASISYDSVTADSGYLSDLTETARQSDKAAEALMESPATGSSIELIMSTFDDTKWDIEATGAKLIELNRECHDLEKRVKSPTRFPIVPLESTIARAGAKADSQSRREALAEVDVNTKNANVSLEFASVDKFGRTRAAAKRLSATAKVTRQPAEKEPTNEHKISHNFQRPQGQNKRHASIKKSKVGV
ncbi:hypothetical protein DE146DRAFT_654061 [Phaeosphaeria sp. MPI-PUGE-AT-0046c]|nr:hypothetical protein DE146DRAFT_654061 [Phaeosphaeria sp. MPI-PUGE-AT-0046c]